MKKDITWKATIYAAVITSITSIVVATIQSRAVDKLEASSIGSLENGQKVCHVHIHKKYMNSIVVPSNWQSQNCRSFLENTSGTHESVIPNAHFALGGVFAEGTYLGSEVYVDSSAPALAPQEKNCGWGA